MYNKTDTINDLILWLQASDDGVSLKDIMERYGVSLRTAIRMKDAIAQKYPQLQEISGRYNTKLWKLPQGAAKEMVSFSLDEVHALQSAIKLMQTHHMMDSHYLDRMLYKIKSLMGSEVVTKLEPDAEALLEAEGYALRPGPRIKVKKEFIEKLRLAVIACRTVLMKYQSKSGEKNYMVDPYGFLYGNKHYLIAWDHYKRKICTFDLNKVQDLEIDVNYFARDPKFSLHKFSEQSFGVYQEEPFDVEWLFDKEVADSAAQYIFHPTQNMRRNRNGTLTVKFRAGGAREMDWHLYTWGNHVKVIKPKDFDKRKIWKG
ncbi:MAG: WYL domain-containing protein [Alphaproteobacteria bacterium]|nr:WYL domain-containing protein [Alphaproteobacteria bacterium]MBR1600252.1 WYL domain-containing protein [Alphaproteobacteria bacterium]